MKNGGSWELHVERCAQQSVLAALVGSVAVKGIAAQLRPREMVSMPKVLVLPIFKCTPLFLTSWAVSFSPSFSLTWGFLEQRIRMEAD